MLDKTRRRWMISIPQTNEEVLEKIQKFLGYGNCNVVKKRKEHWKDAWVYRITAQLEALDFTERILPYLIVKKGLGKIVLADLQNYKIRLIKKQNLRKEKLELIIKLIREGKSYRQIEREFGMGRGFVYHILHAGVAQRKSA